MGDTRFRWFVVLLLFGCFVCLAIGDLAWATAYLQSLR